MKRETSGKLMRDMLKFLSIQQRITMNVIKMCYKIENGLLPDYLKRFMNKIKNKTTYNLRRKSLYDVPNFTKKCTQDSLFYKGLLCYNDFKNKMQINDRSNIKSEIMRYVKEYSR